MPRGAYKRRAYKNDRLEAFERQQVAEIERQQRLEREREAALKPIEYVPVTERVINGVTYEIIFDGRGSLPGWRA